MITISISILVPESTELAHGVLSAQPILSLFAVTVISAVLGPILSWWYSRVAEVGKLSASAKNAFNSFVGRVFANSRQKNVVFLRITKIATKR